jgi:inorganic triphosphatase YgiF
MADRELEGKMIIVPARIDDVQTGLKNATELSGYHLGDRSETTLVDRYFDTRTGEFAQRRIALRVRGSDGSEFITLKGPSIADGQVQKRLEVEREMSPESIGEIIAKLADFGILIERVGLSPPADEMQSHELVEISKRETCRTTRTVSRVGDNVPVAELAVDRVTFHAHTTSDGEAAGRSVLHGEVEVEAVGNGSVEVVTDVLEALSKKFPGALQPSPHSKLAIANALDQLADSGRLASFLEEGGSLSTAGYIEIDRLLN